MAVVPNLDQCVIESVGSKTTNFEPLALSTSNQSYTYQVHYKHLKKGAHQSHLGRQKMGWFPAD